MYFEGPGWFYLRSELVETATGGRIWQTVDHHKKNEQLNGMFFPDIFAVAGSGECHFIRLVNIDRNHFGTDRLLISASEIFE
jgi:hypothetical protein